MGVSSQPSSSPPPTADSLVVNSDEMRILLQHRKELDESLAQMEAQIFHDEGSYIKETPCGNVIRGFESFHDSKLNAEQPKKSRMEVIEERIFSKSSFLFWRRSRDRAAREEAKKREREQHQAMLANRAMYMGGGGGSNGAAEGAGHVQPLGYGSYGSAHAAGSSNVQGGSAAPAGSHHGASGSHKSHSHKKRHPDGHGHGHKKKKKKRSSTNPGSGPYLGGGNSQGGGDGGGGGGSSAPTNRYDGI
eukprot:g8358.t1